MRRVANIYSKPTYLRPRLKACQPSGGLLLVGSRIRFGRARSKFKIFAKIRDFRRNFRFSSKFQIFAKFSDLLQNFRFSPKFQIFAQNVQICFPAAAEPQDLCCRRCGGGRAAVAAAAAAAAPAVAMAVAVAEI